MSKRVNKIIADVSQRWKDTITGKTPVDVAAASKLIRAHDSKAKVFQVDTPKQFYIAQAVMRGRMTKEHARDTCTELGVDPAFLADIRKIGGLEEIVNGHSWWRRMPTSVADNFVQEYLLKATEKPKNRFGRRPWRRTPSNDQANVFLMSEMTNLYNTFIPPVWVLKSTDSAERAKREMLRNYLAFDSRKVERSLMSCYSAVSGCSLDILNDNYDVRDHWFDATQAEIIARLTNSKDPAVNIYYEIFHNVPAFLRFRNGFLLLAQRPTVHLNAEGSLHNDTGAAVEWVDGAKFWFLDGHMLQKFGEKIITAPDTLTVDEIAEISNEEERRIAIDRYGWGNYLAKSGGQVIDYRENWVDNTVEVLIQPGEEVTESTRIGGRWRGSDHPLRMVLACRSTGRKYFIAVPNRVTDLLPDTEANMAVSAPTCEMAQKWLADGSTCEFLPYAKHSLNIVGAS